MRVYSSNGKQLSNIKEIMIDNSKTDKSEKHNAKWKKFLLKGYMLDKSKK